MPNTKDLKQLVFQLPIELHTDLKTKCAQEGKTIKSVLIEMVEQYVQENKNK